MKKTKLVLALLLVIAVALVIVQNSAPVQARLFWMTLEVPVFVLLFITATGGFLTGLLAALIVRGGAKARA